MKPTLKIALDTRRQKESGLYPVKLQLTYRRETKRYSTEYSLTTDQFNYVLNPNIYKKTFDAKVKRALTEIQLILNAIQIHANDICSKIHDFSFQQFEKKFYQKHPLLAFHLLKHRLDSATANIKHDLSFFVVIISAGNTRI